MYPSGNLFISVEHGKLEAIIKEPQHAPKGVALVLHPHPLGGGTMHNKVVYRSAAALNEAGLTTLRINFRGVGQSTGVHDFGKGELDDANAGLDYLSKHYPGQDITLCGFSFGSRVGMEIGVNDDRVKLLISIGTPLSKYSFDFLKACRKPLLLVHGEHDEFGNVQELRVLASKIEDHSPVKLVVVSGADHFFEGHLDEVKSAITEWVANQLTT